MTKRVLRQVKHEPDKENILENSVHFFLLLLLFPPAYLCPYPLPLRPLSLHEGLHRFLGVEYL